MAAPTPPAVSLTPAWLLPAAGAFLLYFALLVYCDVRRPIDPGVAVVSRPPAIVVTQVTPGSAAARAGVAVGDEIVAVDGRALTWRLDWIAVTAQIRPGVPIVIDLGPPTPRQVTLVPEASSPVHWRRREGLALVATRLTQLVSLVLALFVGFRSGHDRRGQLGAWLLASLAVFCVAPPWGQAAVWRALPAPVGWALWLPHSSALVLGAIIVSFFARFRPEPAAAVDRRLLALVWLPTAVALVWHARFAWSTVYAPAQPMPWSPWSLLLPILTLTYAAGGLVLLLWRYRQLIDLNERRRVRVLVAGTLVGITAALSVVTVYWAAPDAELGASPFTSTALFAGMLVSLVFPASLAYAVLRHRLLDVSLIIRQGVRYALARRALLSTAPTLAVVVTIDLFVHADQPVSAILAARGWIYGGLVGLVVLARLRRDAWLDALDRRFFRDRYDGQRVLREILASVRETGTVEPAAARIVDAVARALHPTYAMSLSRGLDGEATTLLARTPADTPVPALARRSRLLELAHTLGRPLDVSAMSAWGRLPPDDEWTLVRDRKIELIVPLTSAADGPDRQRPGGSRHADLFLLLGPKRSEEPYTSDDIELLSTIAEGLATVRASRPAIADQPPVEPAVHHDPTALAECPECGRCEGAAVPTCPDDGTPLLVVPIPRRLNARYAIERRLGRGGMGVVYLAHDTALDRRVAIKVIRWDSSDPGAAQRFVREARAAASLAHPHVVTVHDVGTLPGGAPFLVMEYLPGPSLREMLATDGPPSSSLAVAWMSSIGRAVDAAHAAGLVHGDLKPENVMLGRGHEPKVTDFGLARAHEQGTDSTGTSVTGVGGGLAGTPAYMAPEQIRQEPPSPAWDRWALAVMAYELLTGELPFATGVGEGRLVAPPFESATDERVRRLFRELLSADPARRPASSAALVAAIAEALEIDDALAPA